MKRNGGIFAFLSIMFSSLVSAQTGPVEGLQRLTDGARESIIILIQFVSDVLFDLDSFDEFFFAKIIIFLILFFVVYTVLKQNDIFGRDKKITIIITSAITILATRYLPVEFVQVILIQYTTFAVAVTTLLPLVIFLFFLHQSDFGSFGRKAGWAFYGASLISMTAFRYDELGEAAYIYWIGIGIVVIAFIFDGIIHTQFNLADLKNAKKSRALRALAHNNREIKKLEESRDDAGEDSNLRKNLNKEIKKWTDRNKKLSKYM